MIDFASQSKRSPDDIKRLLQQSEEILKLTWRDYALENEPKPTHEIILTWQHLSDGMENPAERQARERIWKEARYHLLAPAAREKLDAADNRGAASILKGLKELETDLGVLPGRAPYLLKQMYGDVASSYSAGQEATEADVNRILGLALDKLGTVWVPIVGLGRAEDAVESQILRELQLSVAAAIRQYYPDTLLLNLSRLLEAEQSYFMACCGPQSSAWGLVTKIHLEGQVWRQWRDLQEIHLTDRASLDLNETLREKSPGVERRLVGRRDILRNELWQIIDPKAIETAGSTPRIPSVEDSTFVIRMIASTYLESFPKDHGLEANVGKAVDALQADWRETKQGVEKEHFQFDDELGEAILQRVRLVKAFYDEVFGRPGGPGAESWPQDLDPIRLRNYLDSQRTRVLKCCYERSSYLTSLGFGLARTSIIDGVTE